MQPAIAQTNKLETTGNVGIGTTSPDQLLTINGGNLKLQNPMGYPFGTLINMYMPGNTWAREYGFAYNGTGKLAAFGAYAIEGGLEYAYIGGNSSGNSVHAAPWMVFKPNGNIGIGLTNPPELLSVRRDVLGSTMIRVHNENLDNTSRAGIVLATANGGWSLTAVRGGGFSLSSPTVPDFFWTTNTGNVGIGTQTPGTYRLAVEGTIGARKVKVTQAAWADFVFDPEYELMSLPELEQFVKKHRHLPEIPSAETVASEGLDLGDINKKLLQKIEEQSLYIIELNKQLQALSERMEKLEAAK